MPSALIRPSTLSARLTSDAGLGLFRFAESLRCHQRQEQTLMFYEHVVELPDEMPGQLLLVGLLGDDRLPRPPEFVHEAGERYDEGLAEQRRLRTEVAEQQVFGDARGLGDFTRRGAAVVLAGEQGSGGVEQKLARRATGPSRCGRHLRLSGGRSLRHEF